MNELTRSWRADDLALSSDGRTVHGLCVPFGVEAEVNDGAGPYREMFRMGAFSRSIAERGSRIKLLANHQARQFPIGRATSLREDPAGLVGEFRLSQTRDGDEALQLVRDGVVDSFSVSFAPVKHRQRAGGLVERVEVALREVSLVSMPAYADARVAGVRGEPTSLPVELARARLILLRLRNP